MHRRPGRWRLACATLTVPCALLAALLAAPVSGSTIRISNLSPQAGATVGADTVLRADITYHIGGYHPGHAIYTVVPMFTVAGDSAQTFNRQPGSAALKLSSQSGTVHLDYPIRAEWVSGQLAKPVKVMFMLMKSTRSDKIESIAQSNKYEYEAP